MRILVINGPNLNMLGKRDVENYGILTLSQINELIIDAFPTESFEFFQSNSEGEIIDKIHQFENYDALLINPGAYTHTSIAIRDALEIVTIPKVSCHLSDYKNREDFRKKDYISDVVEFNFSGEKEKSYIKAVKYLLARIK